MELDFSQLMQLILTAVVLVQSAMIHRSLPREAWDKYLDQSEQAAAKTASKLDDKFAEFQRTTFTPLMERFGFFKSQDNVFEDLESKNADNPLVGLPESKPVQPFTNVASGTTPIAGTNHSFYTPDATDEGNG